jgi:hypothetical protein
VAPGHPLALLRLGQHKLHKKESRAAQELLNRAALAAPNDPIVQLNLAFVARMLGDESGEGIALNRAIAIDPYCYPALLVKADWLERKGKPRLAARTYKDVLAILPPADSLPPEMRSSVERAQAAVRENADALAAYLAPRLSPGADPDGLQRFEECKGIFLGNKKLYVQQPTLLNFPGLPAIPFYPRQDFPWLSAVENATDTIRDELLALLRDEQKGFEPYVNHPEGAPLNQWKELNRSPKWGAYFLWSDGKRIEDHCAQCPRTAELVAGLPLADVPNCAPSVFFSLLSPKTRIPPHTGVTNARLVVHVPLVVPDGCGFRVGNETREWKPGNAWVFDDTIEHEAWNDSPYPRAILIFDIWNPHLTPLERGLVSELINGAEEFYRAELSGERPFQFGS